MSDTQRAVLFINGVIEDHGWIKPYLKTDDFLVSVDGGYRHMQKAGVKPHLLVGDMDSLDSQLVMELESSGVELLRLRPEKDETDLEITLLTALQRGFTTLRIIGGFGGRMDHWLANMYTLLHPAFTDCDMSFIGNGVSAFLIRNQTVIDGQPGDTVSLLPMSSVVHGVKTDGLKYPLRGEILYRHQSRGVSNEMIAECASVTIDRGSLLCIHLDKDYEKSPF